ncbi:biotin--[acetyl-CoA-carboxylase] ligase [Spongisporangium articulatum]|uniref:Biotin--[acetyl-CoA-carboxylase] ligase n=1 Tax=Spongisporangium articulatum TaxID=3362603 RepID=A0ABW8AQW2_9ACTN
MADSGPTPSRWSDLDRPPLDAAALRRALLASSNAAPGAPGWRALDVVQVTGSTNADVVARAGAGEEAGYVLLAEDQTAGRGRRERAWSSPPRAGLALSVLLRPAVPADRLSWVPLLGGLAVASALRRTCGLPAVVKWPNDVLVPVPQADGRLSPDAVGKVSGLLAEVVPAPGGSPGAARQSPAVVLGIGVNVTQEQDELPVPTATSLRLAGAAVTDRFTVAKAVLRELAERYDRWTAADGDPRAGLAAAYREACDTIGRDVTVHLPDGSGLTGATLTGRCEGVDDEGRLLVAPVGPDGSVSEVRALSVGDVVHVRPADRA